MIRNIMVLVLLVAVIGPVFSLGNPPAMTGSSKPSGGMNEMSTAVPSTGKGFPVVADTWVYQFRPDKNYGDGYGWKDITGPDSKATPRIFIGFGGTDIKIDGEEHLVMREDDILAILEVL